MENPSIEYDEARVREDDVVCAQLRMNQEALRKHRRQREDAQEGSRKRLREGIESGFVREKLLASIHASATNITGSILPKFKVGFRYSA